MSTGSSRPDTPTPSSLTVDLRDGLSPSAVGIPEGKDEVILGDTEVTLLLPGGATVERSVSDVGFRVGRRTMVELYERNLSIDSAVVALERAVDDLGISPTAVAEWAEAARARTPEEGYAPRVLRGAGFDPWTVEVGVNHSPGRRAVTIHTTLTHRP